MGLQDLARDCVEADRTGRKRRNVLIGLFELYPQIIMGLIEEKKLNVNVIKWQVRKNVHGPRVEGIIAAILL